MIKQGDKVLGSIRIFTGVERNGFALDEAKKTKTGFEISVEYGSRYYYHKRFIFICKRQRFYLSKVIVDSFDKVNPAPSGSIRLGLVEGSRIGVRTQEAVFIAAE